MALQAPPQSQRHFWRSLGWALGFMVMTGGASALFVGYLFPRLAVLPGFGFLNQRAPVVVQRVEQVRLDDGVDTQRIYEQIRPATVTVISYQGTFSSRPPFENKPAVGTGFIVTADGLIFSSKKLIGTTRHTVKVAVDNGRVYDATIIAFDPRSDLAILKIAADNLPIVRLNFNQQVDVGDKALAIGPALRPFNNLLRVVTVSRRGESYELLKIVSSDEAHRFLGLLPALDAEFIGGPIVNRDARLIGQVTENGGLPADYLVAVLEVYLSRRALSNGRFGLRYIAVTPFAAQLLQLPKSYGALVVSPPAQSGAAGLREGDFIYKINGREIDAEHSLDALIASVAPADALQIGLYRGGQMLTLPLLAQ